MTVVLKMRYMVLCALNGLREMYELCCRSPRAALAPSSSPSFCHPPGDLPGAAQLRTAPGDTGCRFTAPLAPLLLIMCLDYGIASGTAQNSLWTSLLKDSEPQAAAGLKHLLYKQPLKQRLPKTLMSNKAPKPWSLTQDLAREDFLDFTH